MSQDSADQCRWRIGSGLLAEYSDTTPLFTVVTVNGVDVYFYRLTGGIDGIGFNLNAHCKPASTPGLADSAGFSAHVPPPPIRK